MAVFPVKYVHSGMRGAPVVSGTPGSRIGAIDAFLLTGFGAVTAQRVTVAGGIATATLQAGQSFEPHTVIAVAGATPDALNGEARVLTATPSQITFATAAADGPASGTITIKVAPVGHWTKVFAGTNKAVYRSTHPKASGFYLRVDDSADTYMRVRGFESMSDIDNGTGPFPTDAQIAGGGYWVVAAQPGNGVVNWDFAADARFFAAAWAPDAGGHVSAPLRGFGDLLPRAPAGDVWAVGLSCLSDANFNGIHAGGLSAPGGDAPGRGLYLPRSYTGQGSSRLSYTASYCGGGDISGGDNQPLGPAPNPVDGSIEFCRLFARAGAAYHFGPRADLPGVLYCPQGGLKDIFSPRDSVTGSGPLAGRRLVMLPAYSYWGQTNGFYAIDTTGPWRED